MTSRMIPGLLLGTTALLLTAGGAGAQARGASFVPRSTGLIVNVRLGGTNLSPEGGDGSTGGGAGFGIGYAFTPQFALLLNADAGAFKDESLNNAEETLSHGDLLGRFTFYAPNRVLRPYVEAGFTARVIATNDEVDLTDQAGNSLGRGKLQVSGSGPTIGGGLQWFVQPALALDFSLKFTPGEFDDVKFRNVTVENAFEIDANTTRFGFGISWYPMKGRSQ